MKSTYFAEITTQKAEKYLFERGKLESTACLPAHLMSTKKFSVSLLKTVLLFSTNQVTQFISYGIGCSYFSLNLLLSFLLWYDFKIQVKLRGGVHFYV